MQFFLSVSESKINNCRIARNVFPGAAFDLPSALKFIATNKVDVCKIRISAADYKALADIQYCGIYNGIYSVNYSNSWLIDTTKAAYALPENIQIRKALKSEENEKFIDKVLSTRGWFNYVNPVYNEVLRRHEHQASVAYFSSFLSGEKGVYAWILENDGVPAGIFMASAQGSELNGSLYGILPEYRSRGLAKYIFMFMHNFCLENHFEKFNIDVGITNIASQQAALSGGMKVREVVINIYLYPLLNKTLAEGEKMSIKDFNEQGWRSGHAGRTKLINQRLYKSDKDLAAFVTLLSCGELHQAVFEQSDGQIIRSVSILT